jgi:hypothetical protein
MTSTNRLERHDKAFELPQLTPVSSKAIWYQASAFVNL